MRPSDNPPPSEVPDWLQIAEKAAKESDPKKLIQLVRALCDRLQDAELKKNKAPRAAVDGNRARGIFKPPAA